jgi:filamentous hemagglutinin family protein
VWIVAFIIHGCTMPIWANPAGEQVISGGVTFERGLDGSLTISQGSDKAIIHWQDFSIGAGELTKFVQPSSTSAVLNRVIGGLPSSIHGTLQANGRVLLINPNGILVGPTGRIDVGGFLASTLDVSDGEFLGGGDMIFRGTSTASVVNQGTINAIGGDIFLFAQTVENSGTLNAPQGTVGMAAGTEILLAQAGDERVFVRAGGNGSVTNGGTITAATAELKAHGNLYALAVNNTGVIRATSAAKKGGRVFLTATGGGTVRNSGTVSARGNGGAGGEIRMDAGPTGKVENSGTLDADAIVTPEVPATVDGSTPEGTATGDAGTDPQAQANAAAGGQIVIMADQIDLLEGSMLRANGRFQGGTILVGGGFQGRDPKVINATKVSVSSGVTVQADGGTGGGRVIVWSDGETTFGGSISARAMGAEGQGGFAEVSGKETLDYRGIADLRGAGAGVTGTLLLDPTDFTVGSSQASTIVSNLASSNVVVSTSGAGFQAGNLTVSSPLNYTSANSLTFLAHGSISFLGSVQNGGSGAVQAVAGWDGSTGFSGTSGIASGTVMFNTIVSAGAYGAGSGDIQIGSASSTAAVYVGSRFGAMNTAASSLNLRGSDTTAKASAQLGLHKPEGAASMSATGPINVTLKGQLSLTSGNSFGSFTQMGNGGLDATLQSLQPVNNFSGDITIVAPTSITVSAGEVFPAAYAQIGNGGHGTLGTHSGNLTLTTGGDLLIRGGAAALSWAAVGNGGYASDGNHSGDIRISAQNVTLQGGLGTKNEGVAQIGHGGALADGSFSGAIVLNVSGNLSLLGGSSSRSTAHIGHGSFGIAAGGSRQGAIDIRVGGETSLVNGTGSGSIWAIGHNVPTIGSNAEVYFSTGTLDYTAGSGAALTTLTTDFANKLAANLVSGTVTVASTGSGGMTVAGAFTYNRANTLTLLSTRNLNFSASVQNNGTGAVQAVAGWNGTTGVGSGFGTSLFNMLVDSGAYGMNNGSIQVGATNSTTNVSFGSRFGATNVAAQNLSLFGSNTTANSMAEVGYLPNFSVANFNVAGDISVRLKGDLVATGGSTGGSHAFIGHGGRDPFGGPEPDGDLSGAISVITGGNITLTGGVVSAARIGHGGEQIGGALSGTITVSAGGNITGQGGTTGGTGWVQIGHGSSGLANPPLQVANATGDIFVTAAGDINFFGGSVVNSWAQIGHGNRLGNGDHSGNITVSAANITLQAGTGNGPTQAQIGHGGYNVFGDFSGDITIHTGNLTLQGGSFDISFAQVGHGGNASAGNFSGAITVGLTGNLSLIGGTTAANAYAMIGHGEASTLGNGNRQGNVDVRVAGESSLVNGAVTTSGWFIGHKTIPSHVISNAQISFTTGTLDYASGTGATLTTLNADFATKFIANLVGGSVTVGSSGSGGLHVATAWSPASTSNLTFLSTRDVVFSASVQNNGTGAVQAVAGWDGSTGVSAGTVSLSSILSASAYGLNSGSIFIGSASNASPASVGSRFGATNAAAYSMILRGSDTTINANAQLGYREPIAASFHPISGPINVNLKGLLSLTGGSQNGTFTQVGQGGLDATLQTAQPVNNFSGDITIVAPTSTTLLAGTGTLTYAQIGNGGHGNYGTHSGNLSLITGDLLIQASPTALEWAQIGNGGYGSDGNHNGNIAVTAQNVTLQGGMGSTNSGYAQIGHGGALSDGNLSGAITLNISGNLSLSGGSSARSPAQIGHGHFATFPSDAGGTRQGNIDIRVAGESSFVNGTGDTSVWLIGHHTKTAGGLSNSEVYFSTGTLDYTTGSAATSSSLNADFATKFISDLAGGAVTVASTGAGGLTVSNDFTYGSSRVLTLLSTRDLAFSASLQNSTSGAVNLGAGWDGSTGLTATPGTGPLMNFAAIQEFPSSYGNMNGAVIIGTGTQTSIIAVGSNNGGTNVVGNSLVVQAGSTGIGQLGYHSPQATGSGIMDVRVKSFFHVLNRGLGGTAQIGHGMALLPGGVVVKSTFTFTEAMAFGALGRGEIQFSNGSLQNSSATGGDITLVAGWDGATGVTGSAPVSFSAILANPSSYGSNQHSVTIGDATQGAIVSVGSANGSTNIAAYALNLRSGNAAAQLGYRSTTPVTGTFHLSLIDHLTAWATTTDVQLGHGVPGTTGNVTISSAFTFDTAVSFAALARRNINVLNSSIQNSSAAGGDVTLVAGWDGITEVSGLHAIDFSAIRALPGSYGNLAGTVTIAGGSKATAVGSANGHTNVAAYALSVDASTTSSAGLAQLGYRGVAGSTSAFDIDLKSYFQALNRGTVSTTQIGNGTSVSAGGVVITSAFEFTQPFSFSALARRDVSLLGGQIQNSAGSHAGTGGAVVAIGGWDGLSGITSGLPTNLNAILAFGNYGQSGGSVVVGSLSGVTAGSAIGSQYAATTVAGYDVRLYGNGTADATQRYAQVGYRVAGSTTNVDVAGNITVQAKGTLLMTGLAFANSDMQIGHGGRGFVPGAGPSGNWSGDITVGASVMLIAANGTDAGYAQVGHGGVGTSGTRTGDIVLNATHTFVQTISLGAATRIGHGGQDQVGDASGDIHIFAKSGLALGGGGLLGTQIGHGGNHAQGDFSGDIDIVSEKGVVLNPQGGVGGGYAQIGHGGDSAGGVFSGGIHVSAHYVELKPINSVDPAQIGHGGIGSSGNQSGDITVVTDNLVLKGSDSGLSHAQIGHGDGLGLSGGTRQGAITITVAQETDLIGGTGAAPLWQIGHRTSVSGGVSNAPVSLTTGTLDDAENALASNVVLDESFATVFARDLAGGDVYVVATNLSDGLINTANWAYQSPHDLTLNSARGIRLDGSIVNTGVGSLMFITDSANPYPLMDATVGFVNHGPHVSAGGGVTVFAPSIRTSVLGSLAQLPRQYGIWYGDPAAIIGGVNFKEGHPTNDNKPFNGPPNPPGPPFEPGQIFSPNSFPADLQALGALLGLPPEGSLNFDFSGGVLFLNTANLNSESADYEGGNPHQNEGEGSLLHQNSSGVMGEEKKNDEDKKEKGNGEQPGT